MSPRPPASQPTCPAHLTPSAKAEWKRLAQSLNGIGLLTQADRTVMAAYCQAYGHWVEAERNLAQTPKLLKTPAGYVQASPWIAISNKQVELMTRLMAELGLTPSSRSRLAVQIPVRPKLWEFGLEEEQPATSSSISDRATSEVTLDGIAPNASVHLRRGLPGCPASADEDGDPVSLAEARSLRLDRRARRSQESFGHGQGPYTADAR